MIMNRSSSVSITSLLLLAALLLAHATSAFTPTNKPCNIDDTYLVGQQFDIEPTRPKSNGVSRRIGGTIKIKTGCVFTCFNCTLVPPGLKTYFYGIPKGQPEGKLYPRIVEAAIGTMDGHTGDFALSGYSWSDLDGVGYYSENDNVMFGRAMLGVEAKDSEEDSGAMGLNASIMLGFCSLVLSMLVM